MPKIDAATREPTTAPVPGAAQASISAPDGPALAHPTRLPGQRGVLAIDPGDRHIGLASGVAFASVDPATGATADGAEDDLRSAFQMAYEPALWAVDAAINSGWVDVLIVEDWRIYEDEAPKLVGSTCDTARMIGAFTWMVRKHNRWAREVQQVDDGGPGLIEFHLQPAHLQDTTRSYLRKYGIDRTSNRGEDHALSAELHWWFCVMQMRGLLEGAQSWKVRV